jgi:N-acetylmuramoyl-L-alanine amidase
MQYTQRCEMSAETNAHIYITISFNMTPHTQPHGTEYHNMNTCRRQKLESQLHIFMHLLLVEKHEAKLQLYFTQSNTIISKLVYPLFCPILNNFSISPIITREVDGRKRKILC